MRPLFLIGSGNVAWHLGRAFRQAGCAFKGVWSPGIAAKTDFTRETGIAALSSLAELPQTDCCIILAVPDHAISELSDQITSFIDPAHTLVVHTSGGSPMGLLGNPISRAGVLYPLQTLVYGKAMDFHQVPILVDATTHEDLTFLMALGALLSGTVRHMVDEQRQRLHLAAVMTNNFIYHLAVKTAKYVGENKLEPALLHPLLTETFDRIMAGASREWQTGPAIRADLATIQRHLQFLQSDPQLAALYRRLSLSINPALNL